MKLDLPFCAHCVRLVMLAGASIVPLATAQAGSSWNGKDPVEFVLSVYTDRPEAIYSTGEKVTFNIKLEQNAQPAATGTVEWVISKDGVPPIQSGTTVLKEGVASITGTLDEPGFLHCEVTYKGEKGSLKAISAGAIDPYKIKPSMPTPADFDAFWAEKKKALAAVPINAKLTPVPVPEIRKGVEVFEYQADSIGAPSVGYFGRPEGAKPKSLPAILFVPGAGVRSANLDSAAGWAKTGGGALFLDLNAHGIPDGKEASFYSNLDSGELKDYRVRGRESRDAYYFLGVYYRVLRALGFLASQPEWDGKRIVLAGGSQGGGLAIAGAALDQRVTFLVAQSPGLSDHTGMVANRIAGWPKAIPKGADGKPDPKILETLRYFDTVNFTPRIKIPAHFGVGFLDVITPPTCTFAAYNNCSAPKDIELRPNNGHEGKPSEWQDLRKDIEEYLAKSK